MAAETLHFFKIFQTNERRLEIDQIRLDKDSMEKRGSAEELSKVVGVFHY